MTAKRISYLVVEVIAGIFWTFIVFTGCLVISFFATLFYLIVALFALFVKNADLDPMKSWITGPIIWAFENSSNLWTKIRNDDYIT
jgi:hypothetical protein